MTIQSKLYTSSELSERYAVMSMSGEGLTRQTIYRWRKQKGFPKPRINTPQLLWLKEDVHKWEAENDLEWLQEALVN